MDVTIKNPETNRSVTYSDISRLVIDTDRGYIRYSTGRDCMEPFSGQMRLSGQISIDTDPASTEESLHIRIEGEGIRV